MNVSPIAHPRPALASPSIVRLPCSGSSKTPASNVVHIHPISWTLPVLFALVVFPASVSAAPPTFRLGVNTIVDEIYKRQGPGPQGNGNNNNNNNNNNTSPSDGSISMSVWLPILAVTVVFALFSFITCVRRCAVADAAASASAANRAGSANANTTRPRRRPRRTPSQISTKSLPPYMKEPGDQELVLFRGPSETEDDAAPPHAMPTLAEDDDEHPEMRDTMFNIELDRIETVDTVPDSSTTNLIRRASASVLIPPELHHADRRRSADGHSLDSIGSESELLAAHQRGISVDNSAIPRGQAPSYSEAVSAEGGPMTISLNDPEPSTVVPNIVVPPSLATGGERSRFSFLKYNPFSSRNSTSGAPSNAPPSTRSESPALHTRTGSALSRFSTRESHESQHSRSPSRNNNLPPSHSHSNSNLLRAFRSHSPGLHAGSSTISLDSISAPLTHTLTRAEFHAPKGGLLTPEQVKLITSREALERFGIPYGPDAVAAFSLSRERLAEMGPPPDFESVTGAHQEQSGASGSGSGATDSTAPRSETLDADPALPRSTSPLQPSVSHRTVERAGSRASTVISYSTAPESDGDALRAQIVQTHALGDESEMDGFDEPRTARPMTPRTARPSSVSEGHERP